MKEAEDLTVRVREVYNSHSQIGTATHGKNELYACVQHKTSSWLEWIYVKETGTDGFMGVGVKTKPKRNVAIFFLQVA